MNSSLAVVCRTVGAVSETFIERHINDLQPGNSIAIFLRKQDKWKINCPGLMLRNQGIRAFIDRGLKKHKGSPTAPNKEAAAFLTAHNVKVLMVEYLDVSIPWIPLAKQLGIKIFPHAHGYDVSKYLKLSSWRKRYERLNDADGVITVSRYSKDRLVDIGINKDKIHVIPCGVSVPKTPPARILHDKTRILAVGRMVPKKAPLLTLEAFRRSYRQNPNLRLDLVGDGPLRKEAAAFVRQHRLNEVVTLHGSCSHEFVLKLMTDCDIFIQHSVTDSETSDQEGLPVAILEAMASAMPVVSTRHAGIPEAVLEGETGLLVDEFDVETMQEHILTLASNPELRQALGLRGWQHSASNFSWELEQQRLLSLFGLEQ